MQRIGFVVLPNFQSLYFAVLTVFEFANISAGEPLYESNFCPNSVVWCLIQSA